MASLGSEQDLLQSLPLLAYHARKSLSSIGHYTLMVSPSSSSAQEDLYLDLKKNIKGTSSKYNSQSNEKTLEQVVLVLDIIFSVIIVITMFLCFFSLSSAMTANLLE